jgi:hypothetical protein
MQRMLASAYDLDSTAVRLEIQDAKKAAGRKRSKPCASARPFAIFKQKNE